MAKPIITIDTETSPFLRGRVPEPFMWGLYDGERYRHFPAALPMMKYIATLGKVKVYAHNGGKFDYSFLYEFFEGYTEVLIINGRLARFMIGDAEFLDSWNILPVPLREFGKFEIDIDKLEIAVRHRHMDEIIRYNRQDCVALWDAVTEFAAKYGTNLTIAGAALRFWQKTLGNDKPISTAGFYHSIKPYYYGGRVECFKKGEIKKPFHVIDINSAYPFAMLHKHPVSVRCDEETNKKELKKAIIPQSLYTVAGVSRGALPYRDTKGGLIFPNDNVAREYHCTGWELQAARDTGRMGPHVIESRKDFLKEIDFSDYVNHFYRIKSQAEKGSKDYVYSKLFLTSLYGKMGCCPENYANYGLVPMADRPKVMASPGTVLGRRSGPWDWGGTLGTFALMVGRETVTDKDGNTSTVNNPVGSDFLNAATAASVTGFVRARLLRHIDTLEKSGAVILYCDTDCIVYQKPGEVESHGIDLGKELGQWSYEGCFSHGAIAGKKLYAFHADKKTHEAACAKAKKAGKGVPSPWKCAHKGVKLSPEQIMQIARGEEITWEGNAPVVSPHRKPKPGQSTVEPRFMHRKVRMT